MRYPPNTPLPLRLTSLAKDNEDKKHGRSSRGRWYTSNGQFLIGYVNQTEGARSGRVPGWHIVGRGLKAQNFIRKHNSLSSGFISLESALATLASVWNSLPDNEKLEPMNSKRLS